MILRLVFFFFAIEFMYAVETALTIPIFSRLRVDESYVSSGGWRIDFLPLLPVQVIFHGVAAQSDSGLFPSTHYRHVE